MTSAQEKAFAATGCDVRFDNLTRQLFATDASIYQIEPIGVAFPRSAQQASAVIRAAADGNISVTPRGAGTSLVGNAIGEGLIVDFSRHNRQITDLDFEKRSVRVGAGVVLDQLNAFLKPHGFCFGPDVATSSRATLGGMIANNSSGARVPVYGTTADHIVSTEIVLVDGRILNIGPAHNSLGAEREKIDKLIRTCVAEISKRMPPGLLKRWPGYGLERFLRAPDNLNEILAGSEGTLAAIFSAELKISPLPCEKGLGLIFFASVADAMQATVELLELKPSAIEHIDRPLLDQTKSQLHFQTARDLLELDSEPCESILLVEFYEDVAERLSLLQSRRLGLRAKILTDPHEMNLVWSVRKSGLSLLTGCVGAAKPVAFIEDAAVRPAQLPAYVAGLKSIMKPLGLEASYYGHAASGLLHVRPVLDLHSATDLRKYRQVADQTSALVRQFKGSLSAEHGVGIARTEYMREQLGDELLGVMREIKRAFDPKNTFNPGKIFEVGSARCLEPRKLSGQRTDPTRIDNHLRENFTKPLELPFKPRLAFAFKDGSFIGNLEQCNGCGGCRKDTPIMCPTFIATGEEIMSTRGRANIIRAALALRTDGHRHRRATARAPLPEGEGRVRAFEYGDPLKSAELDAALSNCLSCKGCTPECPSNVNLALLKAEMLYARHQRDGLPLRERIFSSVDLLGRLGCTMPRLANAIVDLTPMRAIMEKTLGISAKRSLPHYARERFDRWFEKRKVGTSRCDVRTPQRGVPTKGRVILWDDTFVRYHEPHIGIAAVKVLETLGFEVELVKNRKCCGRPAFSQGNLDAATRVGKHNVDLLNFAGSQLSSLRSATARQATLNSQLSAPPILFLEPSCWSMFVEDYRELKIDNAEQVAARCFLFEKFIDDLLDREPNALQFKDRSAFADGLRREKQVNVAIHPHCHAKSLMNPAFMARLVERLPGRKAQLLDTGCCGMAGAFGALAEKYDLSVQVAKDLLDKIDSEDPDVVVASGTSCRHQIVDLIPQSRGTRARHMAELIAEAIA
jgi:FAD/FMN-containing dehydrogenase/Fe-S oxidoreductase